MQPVSHRETLRENRCYTEPIELCSYKAPPSFEELRLVQVCCICMSMPATSSPKKERWTLTVDRRLKRAVIDEARHRGVRPARVLEDIIWEKLNPFGYADVKDPNAYVRALRRKDRELTDEEFLAEIKRWEKVTS